VPDLNEKALHENVEHSVNRYITGNNFFLHAVHIYDDSATWEARCNFWSLSILGPLQRKVVSCR
jgi:hypothetical protein